MVINRKKQLILIAILIGAVISLSVGFAAFSSQLSISSMADVTANPSDFSVQISSSPDSYQTDQIVGVSNKASSTGNSAIIGSDGLSLSNIHANFTEPGESITYTFYIINTWKYKAFWNGLEFKDILGKTMNIDCTPGIGADSELVEDACKGINLTVTYNNRVYDLGKGSVKYCDNSYIEIGGFETVTIELSYRESSKRADGPFSVEFGDIIFDYGSVSSCVLPPPEPEEPSIGENNDNFVGYYVDTNYDGTGTVNPNGIIFADLSYGPTNISNINFVDTLEKVPYNFVGDTTKNYNEYSVVYENYSGDFGVRDVLAIKKKNDFERFYVMAISDASPNTYTWYSEAVNGGMLNFKTDTLLGRGNEVHYNFGIDTTGNPVGRENTLKMLRIWNEGGYGPKTTSGETVDLWTEIDSDAKWFVPSISECAAMASELRFTYVPGLDHLYYWTSSQYDDTHVYTFSPFALTIGSSSVDYGKHIIRLATTF